MTQVHDHLGNAIQGALANADPAATDRLLEVAASLLGFDTGSGSPVRLYTAASIAAGGSPNRLPAVATYRSNGATVDPELNNTQGTILTSAARTASTNSGAQTNHNARGVIVQLDITAVPGAAETLRPGIEIQDPVSGRWITYADVLPGGASKPAATPGSWKLIVSPGLAAGTTALYTSSADFIHTFSAPLPRIWRLAISHSGAGNWTYSASYALIN